MRSTPLGRIQGKRSPSEMSLVLLKTDSDSSGGDGHTIIATQFVHWVNPEKREGLLVTIRDKRAVYPMGGKKLFDQATIIHPAVGVRISKRGIVGGINFRPIMPEGILKLQEMWEAAYGGWPDPFPQCFICNGCDPTDLARCPVCLLASHHACAASAISVIGVFGSSPVPAAPQRVPAALQTSLCTLCQHWLRRLLSQDPSQPEVSISAAIDHQLIVFCLIDRQVEFRFRLLIRRVVLFPIVCVSLIAVSLQGMWADGRLLGPGQGCTGGRQQ